MTLLCIHLEDRNKHQTVAGARNYLRNWNSHTLMGRLSNGEATLEVSINNYVHAESFIWLFIAACFYPIERFVFQTTYCNFGFPSPNSSMFFTTYSPIWIYLFSVSN